MTAARMPCQQSCAITARRADERTVILDIVGELTGVSEQPLMEAYAEATAEQTEQIVLNLSRLTFLNSAGIGVLATLLVRANRHRHRLRATGLNEHCCRLLAVTRLDEAITVHATEAGAVAAGRTPPLVG